MPANPRENANRGFWDGGRRGHGTARESGGRTSGYPGSRKAARIGLRLDLDDFDSVRPGSSAEGEESNV